MGIVQWITEGYTRASAVLSESQAIILTKSLSLGLFLDSN